MMEFEIFYYSALDSSHFSTAEAIKTSLGPAFAVNFLSSILTIRKARYGHVVIQLYSLGSFGENFMETFEKTVGLL